jgi:hypothetical protein
MFSSGIGGGTGAENEGSLSSDLNAIENAIIETGSKIRALKLKLKAESDMVSNADGCTSRSSNRNPDVQALVSTLNALKNKWASAAGKPYPKFPSSKTGAISEPGQDSIIVPGQKEDDVDISQVEYPGFSFRVLTENGPARERLGILQCPHGEVETPNFIFCATKAAMKACSMESVRKEGAQIVLSNTYHLLLTPGSKIVCQVHMRTCISSIPL